MDLLPVVTPGMTPVLMKTLLGRRASTNNSAKLYKPTMIISQCSFFHGQSAELVSEMNIACNAVQPSLVFESSL